MPDRRTDLTHRFPPHVLRDYALIADGEREALAGVIAARDVGQAHVVLRGLTISAGGMVAATTSLPERAEAGRNYDYRYAWIRVQSNAGQAAAQAGSYPAGRRDRLDDASQQAAGIAADAIGKRWQEHDPRTIRTLHAVLAELTSDGYAYRFPTTNDRWATPRARSCCAGSWWRWPCISRASRSRRPDGSCATGRPAARPACTARNTTWPNASCAEICRRRSCTRCCSNASRLAATRADGDAGGNSREADPYD